MCVCDTEWGAKVLSQSGIKERIVLKYWWKNGKTEANSDSNKEWTDLIFSFLSIWIDVASGQLIYPLLLYRFLSLCKIECQGWIFPFGLSFFVCFCVQCISAELGTLSELMSKVASETRPQLSKEEPDAYSCLTCLQDCLHTAQLVLTSSHNQLIEDPGLKDPCKVWNKLELTVDPFPSFPRTRSNMQFLLAAKPQFYSNMSGCAETVCH